VRLWILTFSFSRQVYDVPPAFGLVFFSFFRPAPWPGEFRIIRMPSSMTRNSLLMAPAESIFLVRADLGQEYLHHPFLTPDPKGFPCPIVSNLRFGYLLLSAFSFLRT